MQDDTERPLTFQELHHSLSVNVGQDGELDKDSADEFLNGIGTAQINNIADANAALDVVRYLNSKLHPYLPDDAFKDALLFTDGIIDRVQAFYELQSLQVPMLYGGNRPTLQ